MDRNRYDVTKLKRLHDLPVFLDSFYIGSISFSSISFINI